MHAIDHGWTAFLAAYLLTAGGLILGLRLRNRLRGSMLWAAIVALPVMLVAALGWGIIHEAAIGFFRTLPGILTSLLGMFFVLIVGTAAGAALVPRMRGDVHKRGTVLLDAKRYSSQTSTPGTSLTLAGEDVSPSDETKHFKLIGSTGTGKSTAIRGLLTHSLARGDRAVIADPDASYAQRFYDPGRGDVILSPFDERAHRWDLFAEVIQPHDADQLARSLIPDYDGSDRNWRSYARTFLTAILRQLHRVEERDPARLYYLLLMAAPDELRQLLEATPAAPFLTSDNTKFFESVRSVTAVHTAAIEHVASQTTGELLSVRKWIRDGSGVLFLPYHASEIASLRQLISAWMRLAIFQAMSAPEGDQRLWFVVDELDALGAIDGLKDALARLRKFGGRCVLGFQSVAQVRGTYGDAEAQTIVENCGNTLILRCSASERGGTAEFASRLIGKREIIRSQVSHNQPARFGGSLHRTVSTSDHHITEEAVMASEIEQLPDLAGFLKLSSRPEWRRVELAMN